jgi:hypothetical protein
MSKLAEDKALRAFLFPDLPPYLLALLFSRYRFFLRSVQV